MGFSQKNKHPAMGDPSLMDPPNVNPRGRSDFPAFIVGCYDSCAIVQRLFLAVDVFCFLCVCGGCWDVFAPNFHRQSVD